MGWWLLGVSVCSADLPPAHLRCCLAVSEAQMTETRRGGFAFPPKADIACAMALPLIESHNLVWELGSGMLSPGAVKPRSLPSPYKMNLCCAIYSDVGLKVETLNFTR